MTTNEPSTVVQDDEISLLDLLLVVVENLRLLVIGPLIAGLIALAGSFTLPPVYQSTAILKGTQQAAAVMTTPAVLDPVILKFNLNLPGESLDGARARLKGTTRATFSGKDGLVTVRLESSTPEKAQQMLDELLKSYYEQSKPRGSERERLEGLLRSTDDRIEEANTVARQMQLRIAQENPKATADLAQGYATLVGVIDGLEQKRQELLKTLAGVDPSQLAQPPTLDRMKTEPKRSLIATVVALVAGFSILLFVFIRSAWTQAAGDSESGLKLVKLRALWRRALGMR